MKIVCTSFEKDELLDALEIAPCLFTSMECCMKYNSCRECLENKIEWEIVEGI